MHGHGDADGRVRRGGSGAGAAAGGGPMPETRKLFAIACVFRLCVCAGSSKTASATRRKTKHMLSWNMVLPSTVNKGLMDCGVQVTVVHHAMVKRLGSGSASAASPLRDDSRRCRPPMSSYRPSSSSPSCLSSTTLRAVLSASWGDACSPPVVRRGKSSPATKPAAGHAVRYTEREVVAASAE